MTIGNFSGLGKNKRETYSTVLHATISSSRSTDKIYNDLTIWYSLHEETILRNSIICIDDASPRMDSNTRYRVDRPTDDNCASHEPSIVNVS